MMQIPLVDLHKQYLQIKSEIDSAIEKTIKNSSYIGGQPVSEFEHNFSLLFNDQKVISCANGTDSLEIILKAKGIGEGDEVLVPALTWISTAEAVVTVGATPVFVDVDSEGLIDLSLIEKKLTSRSKGIIPVHLYGKPVNMEKLNEVVGPDIFILEDCAQAHLAKWNGRLVGTFGDAGSFSFFPGKNLGAYGDAGAMIVKDEVLAEQCRLIARHGQKGKHNHLISGRNSRLDGLQAAILNVKLKYLQGWTQRRQEIAGMYQVLLAGMEQIKLPYIPKEGESAFHLYPIEIDNRDGLKSHLGDKGISCGIHYPLPLTGTKPFKTDEAFPSAERISKKSLSLPMYPELREEEIEYICSAIKMYYE